MKRLLLCAFILSLVIFGSVFSLYRLKQATEELNVKLENCRESYFSGKPGLDAALSQLEDYWEEYYQKSTFITRSESLEELSVSIVQLRSFLENGEGDFIAELDGIRMRAFLIYDSQLPQFSSIF